VIAAIAVIGKRPKAGLPRMNNERSRVIAVIAVIGKDQKQAYRG
jgi:hypothetical protein